MTRRLFRLWWLWVFLVWFVSFPWIGFTPAPQWHRIHWVPFADPADKFRDVFANILLFLPFGYSITRRRRDLRGLLIAVVLAAAVSVSAEATQLFSTKRYPSATDVTAAVLGALLGGLPALLRGRGPKPETWVD
jgi:glycopeptide antibiotics resistance protein